MRARNWAVFILVECMRGMFPRKSRTRRRPGAGGPLRANDDPNIPKTDRIAVVLQENGTGMLVGAVAAGRRMFEIEIVMNGHAVVPNRDDGVLAFRLLVRSKTGGAELDVVGLPRKGREAHIYERLGLLVNAAAFVVQSLETEGVEHLDFVLVRQINAAVAASLPARKGHEGRAKLDVQQKILEL